MKDQGSLELSLEMKEDRKQKIEILQYLHLCYRHVYTIIIIDVFNLLGNLLKIVTVKV